MEGSNVVIKVKYGETLRRFRTQILNVTIDGLKEKILSLFSFPPESQLILTYIDEDGDTTTLFDAEDLLDIVTQHLNPLRITVKLFSEENSATGKSAAKNNAGNGKKKTSKEKLGSFKISHKPSFGNNIPTTSMPTPTFAFATTMPTPMFPTEVFVGNNSAAPLSPPHPSFGNNIPTTSMPTPTFAFATTMPTPMFPTEVFVGNNSAAPLSPPHPPITVHHGIRCDGCGVYPITGPRFKSKVKLDYDLCRICFSKMGNIIDYLRIDFPAIYNSNSPMIPLFSRNQTRPAPHTQPPAEVLLDSRFIMDVNVTDGTIIAPSTPFTKIWQMRNSGKTVWPQKTQLVWIGGDKLSNKFSVELQIPAAGVPIDQELDISVDFTSPSRPGRYISYWRMVSPSGEKFGQRVWVIIQVQEKTPLKNILSSNLNSPPVTNSSMNVCSLQTDNAEKTVEIEKTLDLRPYVPIPTPVVHWFDSPTPPPPAPSECEADLGEDEVEERLLKDLDFMGFKNVEENKEILKKNEYDLEKSVDDLCDDDEWDPMMVELEEMGFHDSDVNKMLLKESNGSIKGAVMDLIAQEKID